MLTVVICFLLTFFCHFTGPSRIILFCQWTNNNCLKTIVSSTVFGNYRLWGKSSRNRFNGCKLSQLALLFFKLIILYIVDLDFQSNIALILHAVSEYELALRFLEHALELNIAFYGKKSLKVALSYHLVARTQSCMGDFRSALNNEKETYGIYKQLVSLTFILLNPFNLLSVNISDSLVKNTKKLWKAQSVCAI